MASNTTYGPWINNMLPNSQTVPLMDYLRRTRREEYAQYLTDYAINHELEFQTGAKVLSVEKTDQFYITTDGGRYAAPTLVNATGYFSNPNMVKFPGEDTTQIPIIHTNQFKDASTARHIIGKNRGHVLIVGKRLSAGETMMRLLNAGYEVALSARSKVEYGPNGLMEACLSPFTFLVEETMAKIPGASRPPNLDVRMSSGRHRAVIESGKVPIHPQIKEIGPTTVTFEDGHTEHFDLIIQATGYRPGLHHLKNLINIDPNTGRPPLVGFESRETPGLYFMGLIGLRTFRSQFLRGIREDAGYLADLLAQRIAPHPEQRPLAYR